jgi:hypothetical protein
MRAAWIGGALAFASAGEEASASAPILRRAGDASGATGRLSPLDERPIVGGGRGVPLRVDRGPADRPRRRHRLHRRRRSRLRVGLGGRSGACRGRSGRSRRCGRVRCRGGCTRHRREGGSPKHLSHPSLARHRRLSTRRRSERGSPKHLSHPSFARHGGWSTRRRRGGHSSKHLRHSSLARHRRLSTRH